MAKFAVAKQQWNKAVNLGEAAVQPLVDRLGDYNRYVPNMTEIQCKALKALGDIGAKSAIEPIIAFIEGSVEKGYGVEDEALAVLVRIDVKTAVKYILKTITSREYRTEHDVYHIKLIDRAMNESLHNIDDEDLPNLKNLSDFVISVETGEYVGPHDEQRPVYRDEKISCHQIRKLASKELQRRSKK